MEGLPPGLGVRRSLIVGNGADEQKLVAPSLASAKTVWTHIRMEIDLTTRPARTTLFVDGLPRGAVSWGDGASASSFVVRLGVGLTDWQAATTGTLTSHLDDIVVDTAN